VGSGPTDAEAAGRRADVELGIKEDRDRIARDLHDGVIQRVFAATLAVQALESTVTDPDTCARLADVVDKLDRSIVEIRSVVYRLLRDEYDGHTLRSDLCAVVEEEWAALRLSPTISFSGDLGNAGGEWRHHVLAIVRELLSNAARHAHATRVDLDVDVGDVVVLRVSDDGVGFDPAHLRGGRGSRA